MCDPNFWAERIGYNAWKYAQRIKRCRAEVINQETGAGKIEVNQIWLPINHSELKNYPNGTQLICNYDTAYQEFSGVWGFQELTEDNCPRETYIRTDCE